MNWFKNKVSEFKAKSAVRTAKRKHNRKVRKQRNQYKFKTWKAAKQEKKKIRRIANKKIRNAKTKEEKQRLKNNKKERIRRVKTASKQARKVIKSEAKEEIQETRYEAGEIIEDVDEAVDKAKEQNELAESVIGEIKKLRYNGEDAEITIDTKFFGGDDIDESWLSEAGEEIAEYLVEFFKDDPLGIPDIEIDIESIEVEPGLGEMLADFAGDFFKSAVDKARDFMLEQISNNPTRTGLGAGIDPFGSLGGILPISFDEKTENEEPSVSIYNPEGFLEQLYYTAETARPSTLWDMPDEMYEHLYDISNGDIDVIEEINQDYNNRDDDHYLSQSDASVKNIPYFGGEDIVWTDGCGLATADMMLLDFEVIPEEMSDKEALEDMVEYIKNTSTSLKTNMRFFANIQEYINHLDKNKDQYNSGVKVNTLWPAQARIDGHGSKYGPDIPLSEEVSLVKEFLMDDTIKTKVVISVGNTPDNKYTDKGHIMYIDKFYGDDIVLLKDPSTEGRKSYEKGLSYITLSDLNEYLKNGYVIVYSDKK